MAHLNLLILDEPCAGLDPVARENFLAFLNRLTESNRNLVLMFVTHHVDEIMPLFSHVLLMKDGRIIASGQKEKVLNSSFLSRAFDTEIELKQKDSRYSMTITTRSDVVL